MVLDHTLGNQDLQPKDISHHQRMGLSLRTWAAFIAFAWRLFEEVDKHLLDSKDQDQDQDQDK